MKYLQLLLAITICLLFGAPVSAAVESIDNGYNERITGFSVDMNLKDNGTLAVNEIINYDFGDNQKHGIYRYVPTVYRARHGSPRQSLSGLKVTDTAGKIQPVNIEDNNYYLNLVIGNPDKLVSGIQTYKISYLVQNAISSNQNEDFFAWDAIGTGWDVPLNNVSVQLTMPSEVAAALTDLKCFRGTVESSSACNLTREEGKISLILNKLSPSQGITVNAGFNKGTFPDPSWFEHFFWEQPWYFALPIISLIVYLTVWIRRALGARGRGTIVPIYDAPRDLPPTEASIVLHDYVEKKALAAEIIYLAIKGYIKIRRVERTGFKLPFTKDDYQLIKLKNPDDMLSTNQSLLFSALFTKFTLPNDLNADVLKAILKPLPPETKPISVTSLSDISADFTSQNYAAHQAAYKDVTKKGYYTINPWFTKGIFAAIGIILLVLGVFIAIYMLSTPLQYFVLALPGTMGLLFALVLPVKTREGMLAKENLLGLQMYIKTAEIDRIKFHNAPKKDPQKFEELLPYAIIFGLEKEWGKQFEDVYKDDPAWYDGNLQAFTVLALVNNIGDFSSVATEAMAQASMEAAGSSGGFGGGGGGGGGGGSW